MRLSDAARGLVRGVVDFLRLSSAVVWSDLLAAADAQRAYLASVGRSVLGTYQASAVDGDPAPCIPRSNSSLHTEAFLASRNRPRLGNQ